MNCIEVAKHMIAIDSVSDCSNATIAEWQASHLSDLGFTVETIPYRDFYGIEKLATAARRLPPESSGAQRSDPQTRGGLAFLCHNDVVSVEGWQCAHGGPFDASVADGRLWGRGACDMKGPTAAALTAIAKFPLAEQTAPLYFIITGDEESGMAGAKLLAQHEYFQDMIHQSTAGIICEPTSLQVVNSHKGVCYFDVSSHGVAAHSSTSDGLNANWQLIPFLEYLSRCAKRCAIDPSLKNNHFNPPTLSLNVVIENQPSAANITVGRATCRMFLRPMPNTDWQKFAEEICNAARDLELEVSSLRTLPPLHTPAESSLVRATLELLGNDAPQSVCYATDGCCYSELENLIVLGPGSIEQAHRPDEWIDLEELSAGCEAYAQLIRRFASS